MPDPTTFAQALEVLERRGVARRASRARCGERFAAGARGELAETAKPGDAAFRRARTLVIGGGRLSVLAAAREARRRGLRPESSRPASRARRARWRACWSRSCASAWRRPPRGGPPVCLLAGGETTVTVRGAGQGGRNQELAVAAAQALDGFPAAAVVASLATGRRRRGERRRRRHRGRHDRRSAAAGSGLAPPAAFLAENDTRNYLGPLGDLILTGPTGTNVADWSPCSAPRAAAKAIMRGICRGGHLEPGSRRRPRRAEEHRRTLKLPPSRRSSFLPKTGEAEHLERRARLAEDRLTEVLTAYRQVKTENEGFRDRVTRDVER